MHFQLGCMQTRTMRNQDLVWHIQKLYACAKSIALSLVIIMYQEDHGLQAPSK